MESPPFSASRRSALFGRRTGAGGDPADLTGPSGATAACSLGLMETLSVVRIAVEGSVEGDGEDVTFAGPAEIRARVVTGLDLKVPDVTLSIDLASVVGIGSITGKHYRTACTETLCRSLVGTRDAVQIGFVFQPSGSEDFSACRVGVANFILGYDVPVRRLAVALGSISGQVA